MLTLILDHRHPPEVEAPPDGAAFFRGVAIGAGISVALYIALGLLWWAA